MRAYSAGGVVFRLVPIDTTKSRDMTDLWGSGRLDDTMVEVALVGRSHPGIWALPKGTPRSGETIEQVAVREVQEETGLQVPIGGDTALHDHEYDVVEWFSFAEASRRLTYQNEVNILYQAEEVLQRWLQDQRKDREGHQ